MIRKILRKLDQQLQSGSTVQNGAVANAVPEVDRIDVLQLEDRILYSASPISDDAHDENAILDANELCLTSCVYGDSSTAATSLLSAEFRSDSHSVDIADTREDNQSSDAFSTDIANSDLAQSDLINSDSIDPHTDIRREIVFLDIGVEGFDQLLNDVLSIDDPTRDIEVILLSGERDGVEQISAALAQSHDLDAVHIVSHGTEAKLQLGNSTLSTQTLSGYAGEIAGWSSAFNSNADILLYGCDLASGQGDEFVESLSALTSADVAASDDITGHTDLGGDWELEFEWGSVETELAFSFHVQQNWHSTLDITSDLVAHLEFEDQASLTTSDSAGANDGSLLGASITPGYIGLHAIDLDGDFDRVQIANDASIDLGTTDFTIGFWFKTSQTPTGEAWLLGQQDTDGYRIYVDGVGNLRFNQTDGGSSNTANFGNVNDGNWHHAVVTRAGGGIATYLDGTLVGMNGSPALDLTSAADLVIGARDASTDDFDGQIDDLRIYTRQFSGTEVSDLYDSTFAIQLTTFADELDGDTSSVSNLLATPGGSGISLREAIIAANNSAGDDRILLDAGNYTLSLAGSDDTSDAGDLDVLSNITLSGSGIGSTIIDANSLDRVFHVVSGTLDANHLQITGGFSSDGGAGVFIASGATANLNYVDVFQNDSQSGLGGAIHNLGTLVVADSLIRENTAPANDAGGLYNEGLATLDRVSIINNTAIRGAGVQSVSGTVNLTNVTVSGNTADFDGGGVHVLNGTVNLSFSTISDNTAASGNGGGLHRAAGSFNLNNSIVVDNSASFSGNDIYGAVSSGGNNIYLDAFNFTPIGGSDINGDPGLAALTLDATSGQYIHTIAAGSIAHNASGTPTPTTDQRGLNRSTPADIGSYEIGSFQVPEDLQATHSASGGLSINSDGGNDTYLQADDGGAILGSLTDFTFEARFQMSSPSTTHPYLLDYATAGENAELSVLLSFDAVSVIIGGVQNSFPGTYPELRDGNVHTLSVTWNSAGLTKLFIDGQYRAQITAFQTGYSIGPGGNLIVGSDQDAVGSQFQTNQVLPATLHNVRIFDEARTDQQIAINYAHALPYDESGLIANWSFDSVSPNNTVLDTVAGNGLSILHTAEAGFSGSTEELRFSVDENSAAGTYVGTVEASDADRQDEIAALLAGDPNLYYSADTGKFYQAVGTATDWNSAVASATTNTLNGIAGQLVTIRSATEQAFVRDIHQNSILSNGPTWIGAGDFETEGEWRWYDGTTASDQFWSGAVSGSHVNSAYQNWRSSSAPNDNGAGEDAAYLYADGTWEDNRDNVNYASIVEWNADEVLDANQSLSYSIASQTIAGAFTIDADSGQVFVADGSLLDADTIATHTLTVRVTDVDGNVYDEDFSVQLNDLVEPSVSPTDLSSGIELNTDGGNDAYLVDAASGAPYWHGFESITMEFQVSQLSVPGTFSTFYSKFDTGSESYFGVHADGTLEWTGFTTSNTYTQLFDGGLHHLAFSWDAPQGDLRFYIDGELVEVVSTPAQASTNGGGVFVLGQDQDSVGGSFQSAQAFSGVFHDVRIWDHARTEAEISSIYQHKLDVTRAQAVALGLVANWQMDQFVGVGGDEIIDIVSDGVEDYRLSVAHATGAGYTASTPVEDLNIDENSSGGTSVGFVTPSSTLTLDDIIDDGLFLEAPDPGSYTRYSTGQTFGNWTVESGNVDLLGSIIQPTPLGGRAVELNGDTAGTILQSLTTEIGKRYQLFFQAAGNFQGGTAPIDFRVSVSEISQDFSIARPANWTMSDPVSHRYGIDFTATDTTTDLRFISVEPGSFGAGIADVQVIEIPSTIQAMLNSDSSLSYNAATGKFYRFVDAGVDFNSALTAATTSQLNGIDGQLATIRSEYENELLSQFVRDSGSELWLGASDGVTAGEWNWLEGTSEANDLFWTDGENAGGTYVPNTFASEMSLSNGVTEQNLRLRSNGGWGDSGNGGSHAYVIEWNADQVLSSYAFSLTDDASGRFAIDSSTGEITFTGVGSLDYEESQTYDLQVQVTNAVGGTYTETMTVAINDLPDSILTLPIGQTVAEDSSLTFTSGNGNTISVDTGTGDAVMTLTLSVNDGTLSLGNLTGITFLSGTSQGQSTLTIAGTEANLNAALEGLIYDPTNDFNGSDSLTVTTGEPAATAAGLFASYDFESGAVTDSSGNGNDGTAIGTPGLIVDSERGDVLYFDGSESVQITNGTLGLGSDVSIAAWVNLDAGQGDNILISLGDAFYIELDNNSAGWGVGAVAFASGTYTAGAGEIDFAGDGWHHIAATFNDAADELLLYVDGVLERVRTVTATPDWASYASQDISIGSAIGLVASSGPLVGSADNVRIYNATLSESEIVAIMGDRGFESRSIDITVTPTNDAPVITGPGGTLPYTEDSGPYLIGAAATIGDIDGNDFDGGQLNLQLTANGLAEDVLDLRNQDAGPGEIGVAGSNVTYGGVLIGTYNGPVSAGSALVVTFNTNATLAAVNAVADNLTYENVSDSPSNATRTIELFVTDGDGGTSNTVSGNIAITPRNDAPILDDSAGLYVLNSIDENAFGNAGQTVASILASNAGFGVNDPDGLSEPSGIAIRSISASDGTWQFSINGGITWFNMGSVSPASALLLRDTDLVRYVPDGDGSDIGDLLFAAWDQSDGATPGTKVNATVTGGETSFSDQVATARITVTAVNDAPTFDAPDGIAWTDPSGALDFVQSVVVQDDGKILVGGYGTGTNSYDQTILRYNADGSLDNSFGTAGVVRIDTGGADYLHAMSVQTDGKIVLGGRANSDWLLTRLNSDGSIDTSFNGDGNSDGIITTVFAGSLDGIFDLVVDGSGRIVATGIASSGGGNEDITVVRYNANGSIDTSFGTSGVVQIGSAQDEQANIVRLDSSGDILIAGEMFSGTSLDFFLAKLDGTTGALDTSFGGGGTGFVLTDFDGGSDEILGMQILDTGEIVTSGFATVSGNIDIAVARFDANGVLDTTFGGGDGQVTLAIGPTTDRGYELAVQSDGKLVVVGETYNGSNNDIFAARFQADGSIDSSFGSGGTTVIHLGAQEYGKSIALLPDSDILISGYINQGGANYDAITIRLNADGSLDTGFGPNNTLDGNPNFVEDGSAVILDSDVQVFDEELTALDDFANATLTLVRNGGANADDVFVGTGTLTAMVEGNDLTVNGVDIGAVDANSGGQLQVTFYNAATNALVNEFMRQIAYENVSDNPPSEVQIDWIFNDGNSGAQGSGGALQVVGNTTVSISSINDAPILDGSGAMNLTSITEDDINSAGDTVANIIASAGGDRIVDPDSGAVEGIAITTRNNGNGQWQYSINGGSTWQSVGIVSESSALLLRDSDFVRFLPDQLNGITQTIEFRAWDQTSGVEGTKVDTTTNGDATAFSTNIASATITVTSINDSPDGTDLTLSIPADNQYAFGVSDFGFSDPDNDTLSAIQISNVSGLGTLYNDANTNGTYDVGEEILGSATVTALEINNGRLLFAPAAGTTGLGYASFDFLVQDDGGTANGGQDTDDIPNTITIDVAESYSVSGQVFEDINGDSNLSDAVGFNSASVLLYRDADSDGLISAADVFITSTTTDSSGSYQFVGLVNDTYFVVVDSRSLVASSGLNAGYSQTDVWAEQTWAVSGASSGNSFLSSDGALFGGRVADVSDDVSSLLTAEHVTRVSVSSADVNSIDSAFSFNVVTGVRDGDDALSEGRSIQGSLRQFVDNANALAGANSMRFVPGVATNASSGSGDWWSIALNQNLSTISDADTTIDGTAWDSSDGISLVDSNTGNVNSARLVGSDGLTLTAVQRQELEINSTAVEHAFVIDAGNTTIRDLATFGSARTTGVTGNQVYVTSSVTSAAGDMTLTSTIIGARADGSDPGAGSRTSIGANFDGAVTVINNYFAYTDATAARFNGAASGNTDASLFENNEIAFTGWNHNAGDGITLDSQNTTARGNYIHDVQLSHALAPYTGKGIELWSNAAFNTVVNNTIENVVTAGVGLGGNANNNTVSRNVISNVTGSGGNAGAGILITAAAGQPIENTLSQNSILNVNGVGIDIDPNTALATAFGDGSNINDGLLTAGDPQLLVDSPVLQIVNLESGNLTLAGFVGSAAGQSVFASAIVEFFVSDTGGAGQVYLGSINTDASGNFSGVIVAAGVVDSDNITATATLTGAGTSEFGNAFGVNAPPTLVTPGSQNVNEDQPLSIAGISVGDNDSNVTSVSLSVGNGTLNVTLQGAAVISGGSNGSASFTISGSQFEINSTLATLNYQGDMDYFGADTLNIVATDAGGLSDSGNVGITVAPINDSPNVAVNTGTTVTEGGTQTITNAMLSEGDPDDDGIELTYAVTGGLTGGQLELSNNPGVAILGFTQADIDGGLLQYVHDGVSSGNDSFHFTLTDGGEDGAVAAVGVFNISVASVNNSPSFSNLNGTPLFTENGAAIVLDRDVAISDPELNASDDFGGSSVTLQRSGGANANDAFGSTGNVTFNGGALELSSVSIGSVSYAGGQLTLNFAAGTTRAEVNEVLQALTYHNTSDDPEASVTIDWLFDDGNTGSQGSGGALTANGSTVVSIAQVNDDPGNAGSVIPTVTVSEDALSSVDLSALDLVDVDARGGNVELRLSTSSGGNLYATSASGVAVTGSGSNLLILSGSLADLNNFINSSSNVAYQHSVPDTAGNAADTISIHLNDLGNTGTGGGTDILLGNVVVDITAINDDPYNAGTLPSTITAIEDVASDVDISTLDLQDVDSATSSLTITLRTTTGGTLTASSSGGVTIAGSGTDTILLDGTVAALNAYLDIASSVQFTGAPNANGVNADSIQVSVTDNGNTGSGGGGSIVLGNVNVDISAANDAPSLDYTFNLSIANSNEDELNPAGTSVANMLSSDGGSDPITDIDAGAVEGIAVTDIDNTHGNWQYSTNNGATWNSFVGVSDSAARVLSASDLIRFLPNPDYFGSSGDLTFRAWDQTDGNVPGTVVDASIQGGTTAFSITSETVSTNVIAINDDPDNVGSIPTDLAVLEDTVSVIDLSAIQLADLDAGTNPLTLTLSTSSGGVLTASAATGISISGSNSTTVSLTGTLTDLNDYLQAVGNLLYLHPTLDYAGDNADTLSVSVTDNGSQGLGGGGNILIGTANIDIANQNDAPSVIGESFTMDEDTTLSASVLLNDSDPDGDTITVVLVTGPSTGTFQLNLDGTFTYTPAVNEFGNRSFSYRVSDGLTQSAVVTADISISPVNDAPVAVDDSFAILPGNSLELNAATGLVSNDFDFDGDTLSVIILSPPAHGTLSVTNNGSLSYVPDPNFAGTVSFTYQLTDGMSTSAAATVSIFVSQGVSPTPNTGFEGEPPVETEVLIPVSDTLEPSSERSDADLTQKSVIQPVLRTLNRTAETAMEKSEMSDEEEESAEAGPDQTEDDTLIYRNQAYVTSIRQIAKATRTFNAEDLEQLLLQFSDNVALKRQQFEVVSGTANGLFIGATALGALWLASGSSLVALLASSLPAWAQFDPIFIVTNRVKPSSDDVTVAQIIQQQRAGKE